MRSRRRKLTKAELKAMGATPGLMARRIGPGNPGRARLEMLAPEGPERRKDFIRRLTDDSKPSEGSKTA